VGAYEVVGRRVDDSPGGPVQAVLAWLDAAREAQLFSADSAEWIRTGRYGYLNCYRETEEGDPIVVLVPFPLKAPGIATAETDWLRLVPSVAVIARRDEDGNWYAWGFQAGTL
jgi:hypothetical protein